MTVEKEEQRKKTSVWAKKSKRKEKERKDLEQLIRNADDQAGQKKTKRLLFVQITHSHELFLLSRYCFVSMMEGLRSENISE